MLRLPFSRPTKLVLKNFTKCTTVGAVPPSSSNNTARGFSIMEESGFFWGLPRERKEKLD